MNTLSSREYWLRYFKATKNLARGWLARLTPQDRMKLLDDIMQWEVTYPVTLGANLTQPTRHSGEWRG